MDRHHILMLLGTRMVLACHAPPQARAQSGALKRIGILSFLPRERWPEGWDRTFDDLPRRGWIEGRNLQFEYRDGVTDPQGLYGAARRLVESNVHVIAGLLDDAAFAAKGATSTIPIVAISAFPVEIGLVQSMARPGGNITGVSFQANEENGRVLALLRDIRPGLTRVGVPVNLGEPGWRIWFDGYEKPAKAAAQFRRCVRMRVFVFSTSEKRQEFTTDSARVSTKLGCLNGHFECPAQAAGSRLSDPD